MSNKSNNMNSIQEQQNVFSNEIHLNRSIKVKVNQDRHNATTSTIATYGLSSCYFFLLDGSYEDGSDRKSFTYLYHHSGWIESDTIPPIEILANFFNKFFKFLNDRGNAILEPNEKFSIQNFKNMKLAIGGSRKLVIDPIKDAFSLLNEFNQLIYDQIKSLLKEENYMCLLNQVKDHLIIFSGFTYLIPNEEEEFGIIDQDSVILPPEGYLEYDCETKKGIVGLVWKSSFGQLYLAKMNIDLTAKEQKENHHWEINFKEIEEMSQKIGQDYYSLISLARAFSVIPENALYVSTTTLINAPESTSNELNVPLPHDKISFYYSVPKTSIKFKSIYSKIDVIKKQNPFSPAYTDLIFENQTIFGYKHININIYYLPSSINFYYIVDYDKKINTEKYPQLKVDDIFQLLNQWIPSRAANLNLFISKLKNENEYLPFGEQLLRYISKGEESSPYFIYRINGNFFLNSKFIEWFSRLETFLVFFLNATSTFNKEDPNWIIYLLYQQYQNDDKQICYAPIGFITLYLHTDLEKKRARINQMLILPPYQRKGLGRCLLTAIYNNLRKDSCVQDITAKSPSDAFVALHDLVSLELCHKYLSNLFSKESILKTDRLTKEMIDKARDICKLTKEQTQRVYEIYVLRSIDENDEEQTKRFRLLVQQRLSDSLQFDKHDNLQLTDSETRAVYLTIEYENVLKSYKKILQTFDKYHYNTYFISKILFQ